MNPGKMKNRIAFYRFVTSSDSYGGFLSSGETLVNTVWGYSKAISGEYVDQSGQRQRTNEIEVIIRKKTFDIVDNNSVPREEFGNDWINLIGDILVDIMEEQYGESDNRENYS